MKKSLNIKDKKFLDDYTSRHKSIHSWFSFEERTHKKNEEDDPEVE